MSERVVFSVAIALGCFAATYVLGRNTAAPRELALDVAAQRVFYGHGVRLAAIFTSTGYARALGLQMLAVVLVGRIAGHDVLALIAIALWQMAGQGVVNHILKPLFARARPAEWLFRHESTKAYPSGHSATAVVFYVGLAFVLPDALRLSPPGSWILAAALSAWGLGVAWSRIALGAHFASDVAGGALFGCGWLALGYALLSVTRVPF